MSDTPSAPARESRELKTASGHMVLLKTYLTGREADQFRKVLFEKTKLKSVPDPKVDPAGGDNKQVLQQTTSMDGTVIFEQQCAGRQVCILSLDGDAKNLESRLQDLPSEDFDQVNAACDELTAKTFTQRK